jgi:unsaturated chondroitin disaccharide hydrolase
VQIFLVRINPFSFLKSLIMQCNLLKVRIILSVVVSIAITGPLHAQLIDSVADIDLIIQSAADQYEKMIEQNPSNLLYPRSTNPDGGLNLVSSGDWTSGFFPGTLWYLYEYTNSDQLMEQAAYFTAGIEKEKNNTGTHDLGFMLGSSFGNGYRLTDDPAYENVLIQSAKSLSERFNEKIGCIRSWDGGPWTFPVIIDNMMNLELLFLSSELTHNSTYKEKAIRHADQTMTNHFRPDYSSYHVVDYSDVTGEVISKTTHQGYSDESAWARGQAWGLYGYTMCYRYTNDIKYLRQAEQIALFIIHHKNFPQDMIPYWDFDAPDIPDAPRDVAAASIMCSALFELCRYSSAYRDTFLNVAIKQINILSTDTYHAFPGTNNNFILMHSTGNYPGNSEIDTPINYADYYFIESLTRYRRYLNHSPESEFVYDENGAAFKMDFDASLTKDIDKDSITYRWDFGDGRKAYTLSSRISHTYIMPGHYLVTLISSDKWGGIDSIQHAIDVSAATGFSNPEGEKISVYPNPSTGGFNVVLPVNSLPAFLSMTDMTGLKRHFGIDIVKTWIETNDWSKGLYFLFIQTRNGIHQERMIIN